MNIGEVARLTALPAKTIRYYEDIGLVRPARTENGYRSFSRRDAHNLAFLRRARSLGFGIDECRALLDLYADGERSSADVKRLATAHLADITAKIEELNAMRKTLADLIHRCHGDDRPDCPILDGLGAASSEDL